MSGVFYRSVVKFRPKTKLQRAFPGPRGFSVTAYRKSDTALQGPAAIPQDDNNISKTTQMAAMKPRKNPATPSPSSSIILISPNNQILLLQRVKQSSAFPSAHVFPGGNVSEDQDGSVPGPESPQRHEDSSAYRMAAIRECFEESGLLLARNNGFGRLIEVPEEEREQGRRAVHSNEITFTKWLARKGGRADVDGLVPFTRWITPPAQPKRFTTQMYLYFMPTINSSVLADDVAEDSEVKIPLPKTDGGIEHTTARFLPASVWLRLAQEGRIIMFPPQFFLLHQIAQFLDGLPSPTAYGSISRKELPREELVARRNKLLAFVKTGNPPWTDMCISPRPLPSPYDGRSVMSLEHPGQELAGTDRTGVRDQFVLVEFRKEGPRKLAVISRNEVVGAKL